MANTKSEYRFTVENVQRAEQIIQDYLSANKFTKIHIEGMNYYQINDFMIGKRGFEYYISGNDILIKAYLGNYQKSSELDGFVGCAGKIPYKNSLQTLFEQLQRTNGTTPPPIMNTNNNVNQFVEENNKKSETLTIVGFVLSIIGFILAFTRFTFGFIVYFVIFYLGIVGLKTSKKPFAIATIVIALLSILLTILYIVLSI